MKFDDKGKQLAISLLLLVLVHTSYAQKSLKYVGVQNLILLGKAKQTVQPFQRIDSADLLPMPKAVQGLALNSAGIAILFETNSSTIAVKWKLAQDKYHANMTPISHSGLDLYAFKDGKWQYVSAARPERSVLEQNQAVVSNMDTTTKQMMLYLPLYNSVRELEIGVDKNSKISAAKQPRVNQSKRVVVYGSSIVQGASASRPGMAYPAILQRKLGVDVINLGFSGSAKMEIELAKYLATVTADCYVLDCIPNQTAAQVDERALPFIKYLRSQKPHIPIVLVESVIRENGYFDLSVGNNVREQNESIYKVYHQLKAEKFPNLYYVSAKGLIGDDHEATIDGTHLTDLGFVRIAEGILNAIKQTKAVN